MQSGWLRASRASSTREEHAARAGAEPARADAAPLPKGSSTQMMVPLYYEGHVYRAGSRIRVSITAPGGDQPIWAFGERPERHADGRRSRGAIARCSRSCRAIAVPTPLPPCPGLRGEPCR